MKLKIFCWMAASLGFFVVVGVGNAVQTVTLNQEDNSQKPAGLIGIAHGEMLNIDIAKTVPECFDYNFEAVPVPEKKGPANGERLLIVPTQTTVTIPVQHDRKFGSYKITVTPKEFPEGDELIQACKNFHLPKRDWTINVTTYGWTVGFAGAFTGDKLTDPVFSLRPGKQVAADGTSTDGFFVEKHKGAEDSVKLGAATMIHLFYSDPNKFRIGPSLTWAPLTFGLGIGDSSQARYFLGTSVRFGDQAFLTAGCVFGPRKRLPDGLTDFTTDQNALSSLPTRNSSAFFVGLSYTFLSVSQDTFQSKFTQDTPGSPQKKQSGQ